MSVTSLGTSASPALAGFWQMRSMRYSSSKTIRASSLTATARWSSTTSIADISEDTPIPGNAGLSDCARQIRAREIFRPYHDRIEAELDCREQSGRASALISLHSFTPVFKGATRPWHAGVLYNRDARFAHRLKALLNEENGLFVGDNAPYIVSDASDYTIPIHAERRGLHHVLVEIRQDLIADESGQRAWALRLTRLLPRAYQEQLSKI